MISTALPLTVILSLVGVCVTVGCLFAFLPSRREPAARPLLGVIFMTAIGTVGHLTIVELEAVRTAVGLPTSVSPAGGPWLLIALDVPAVIGGLWFLFALTYTGRDRDTAGLWATAVLGVLAALVISTVGLGLVGPAVGVGYGLLNAVLGTTIVLAVALGLIGVFLIIATALETRAVPSAGAATLVCGIGATLVVPFAATTIRTPVATPVGLTITALTVAWGVRYYNIFEILPAVSVVGRDRLIEELADSVILVDEQGRIRDVNESAQQLLDIQSSAYGRSLSKASSTLPEPALVVNEGPVNTTLSTGRIVRISADNVTDEQGRHRGHLLILRDITDQRRRENRLGVLTHLVADAVQQSLSEIADTAAAVAKQEHPQSEGSHQINQQVTDTAILTARVRDLEEALAESDATSDQAVNLRELVRDLPTEFAIDTDDFPVHVRGNPKLLKATLELLTCDPIIDGASATIQICVEEGTVSIRIRPIDETTTFGQVVNQIVGVVSDHHNWRLNQDTHTVSIHMPAVSQQRNGTQGGEFP